MACLAITASSWDAVAEFNDSANPDAKNPSGVWSYGWKKILAGRFFLALTHCNDLPPTSGWSSASGNPEIGHNSHSFPVTLAPDALTLPPHALFMRPGLNGEYAVLRFTAPADGTYKASGQFYALGDNGIGATTDVWILPNENKTAAFSALLAYSSGARAASFTSKVYPLRKGNTLDFEVGYGANKNYDNDITGLIALIEVVR
ncbi:MAG: hypothetical protein H0X40_01035 [Chthoniobacterales bacterium]|nr:hypothetical protein [Chthoniobacterales bacterium]